MRLSSSLQAGYEKLRTDLNKAKLLTQAITEEVREGVQGIGISTETELIKRPPLIEICTLANGARIIAIDYRCVPGHSTKVIPVDSMLTAAEQRGEIHPTRTRKLIFSSSGNASIWLTKVAREKGYDVVSVVPDYASTPRLHALVALGAEVVLVPGEFGVPGLISTGERLEREISGSKFLNQNKSPDNLAGFRDQGRRAARKLLVERMCPTHFVAGMGTGGTLTGMIRGIRQFAPECAGIGVEVDEKRFLCDEYPEAYLELGVNKIISDATSNDGFWLESWQGASQVPGLSANVPSVNLTDVFEKAEASITSITNETAFRATRLLASKFHQYTGPSTGAAFAVALAIAKIHPNSVILMPICDLGERYEGDLWHKIKRHVLECNKTEAIVGSTIKVRTYVQPDYRTPHMGAHEMGGPLGTASMLHEMEVTCRDLEVELGFITATRDTVGMGTTTPLSHLRYVPIGTALEFKATIIDYQQKGEHSVATCKVECYAQEKEGNWILVGETTHKRCCVPVQQFREQQLRRFAESRL